MRAVAVIVVELLFCLVGFVQAESYDPRTQPQWENNHSHPFPVSCVEITTATRYFAVDIKTQHMGCYENGKLIRVMEVCTGAKEFGDLYGDWTVEKKKLEATSWWPANAADPDGPPYIMRWAVSIGRHNWIHKGALPGYPASHGCIRLSEKNAKWFYNWIQKGDPGYSYENAERQMKGAISPAKNPLADEEQDEQEEQVRLVDED